ncbi:Ltp family lipoprotein [Citricoccus sp. NR2]|uniref:Ltp family lipoprotein n=1 Tax=Citricoccus sp. NR2 TaxID=3004095 RepID=UPI002FD6A421
MASCQAEAEAAAEAEANAGTVSQQNALRSAESYLDFMPFSRSGLIDQLEFENFSTADATWAVDQVTVDWNEQAAKAAENYLDVTGFSRQGLIDQLVFEGYTQEQAVYGVNQTGL